MIIMAPTAVGSAEVPISGRWISSNNFDLGRTIKIPAGFKLATAAKSSSHESHDGVYHLLNRNETKVPQ